MVEQDNVDAQSVAIVGVFGAIVAFVLIVGVQVLYYRMERQDFQVKGVAAGWPELSAMVNEHRTQLSEYHWADRGKQTVTIPIERAMDLEVRALQAEAPATK